MDNKLATISNRLAIVATLEESVANAVRERYPDIDWFCYIGERDPNTVGLSRYSDHTIYRNTTGEFCVIRIAPDCHSDTRGRRLAHELAHIISGTYNSDHSPAWSNVYNLILAIANHDYTRKNDILVNRINNLRLIDTYNNMHKMRDMMFDHNPAYYIPDECGRKDDSDE